MELKELLLKGQSFTTLLKQLRINEQDVNIKDEEVLFLRNLNDDREIIKETVCIEGKNNDGMINLFGTLHYNQKKSLAVFEMDSYEKIAGV